MNRICKILIFKLLFLLGSFMCLYAQPANDLCQNAEDISDGLWHTGTNQLSTLTCADHRLSNCTTPQQSSNLCCGISGIEGSVWYKFTIASDGPTQVEFRNSSCNPVSFLGSTTTLQGFVLRKPTCVDPSFDIVMSCFNPSTAANFNVPFTATAGQEYYIQVDTKKNSFASCTCDNASSANCHSYCSYEVRVVPPTTVPVYGFQAINKSTTVQLKWYYDNQEQYSYFKLLRINERTNDSSVIALDRVQMFEHNSYYSHMDYLIPSNGYYKYILLASYDKSTFDKIATNIVYMGAINDTELYVYPVPSTEFINVYLSNFSEINSRLTIYSTMGNELLSVPFSSSMLAVDLKTFSPGVYYVSITTPTSTYQKAFIVEK